jgi:hypothetical protein
MRSRLTRACRRRPTASAALPLPGATSAEGRLVLAVEEVPSVTSARTSESPHVTIRGWEYQKPNSRILPQH